MVGILGYDSLFLLTVLLGLLCGLNSPLACLRRVEDFDIPSAAVWIFADTLVDVESPQPAMPGTSSTGQP